jgi:predicted GNAT superfamily acetyltransferase
VVQKVGGVAGGAFDREQRLLGFVFGITGVEHGQIVHWSDMLAVRLEAQNLGLGRRLKEFQRGEVAKAGATVIYWTYDPLVARNAHLNFNVFGVRVVRYVRDMYGVDTGSVLHRGIGTDRLVVAWPVPDAALAQRKREIAVARDAVEFETAPLLADPEQAPGGGSPPGAAARIRIAAPLDIARIQAQDLERALQWRLATRAAFEDALARGYTVDGFRLADGRGFYLLSHLSSPPQS